MAEIEYTGALQKVKWQAAEEVAAWGRLTELRQHLYGAATKRMLEAVNLQPGDQVLDIAAGTGDQSRQAARLVGLEGIVLATDISPEMLVVAAWLAKQEGLSNLTTCAMNAEQPDLPESSYDAVISRFGLMLIPDRQQALTEIRRVLKPGGRLAALVWSKPERNPLFTLKDPIVAKYVEVEEPRFDVFSLADVALFASMLTETGFQGGRCRPLRFLSAFPPLKYSPPGGVLR